MNSSSLWLGCAIAGSLILLSGQPTGAIPATEATRSQMAQATNDNRDDSQINFAQHFQDLGVEGSILIYDLNRDRTYEHNPVRNATEFLPASTFKILNSLIALETGVIANDLAILTWDGVERSVPAWNRDLNMHTAFQQSAVWFYQVIARRVGHERMQQWVAAADYGNQTIGNADEIDTFWLDGDLRITPQEQIQFLRRLYTNELPFSADVVATVKEIMIVEQTPDYTIRAKTGWFGFGQPDQDQVGWYVGYVEQAGNVYFFATNIDIRDSDDAPARIELTRRCLKTLQLL